MVIAPARRAGDPGSNPGPAENIDLSDGYSESQNYIYIYIYIIFCPLAFPAKEFEI